MAYGARYFGGEKYFLDDWYNLKSEAEAAAGRIRASGQKARIAKVSRKHFGDHYLVYYKLD